MKLFCFAVTGINVLRSHLLLSFLTPTIKYVQKLQILRPNHLQESQVGIIVHIIYIKMIKLLKVEAQYKYLLNCTLF